MSRRRTIRPNSDLHWDGRASSWPRGIDGGIPGGDANLWMCAEDMGCEIWAHFYNLERRFGRFNTEPLRLEDCSKELGDILIQSLPYNDYRKDLSGAVCNFAKMVAQQLVVDGLMPFEVQAGWDRSGDVPRLEDARLEYIYPDSMVKLGPWLFQAVPRDTTDETASARIIKLDPLRIATFQPPRRYRGPLTRMRSEFPSIGKSEQDWRMGMGEQKVQEDFKTVTRSYNIRRARLSAPLGWNGRGLFGDHIADFHWTCRQLRWHRSCIEVREAIFATLAEVFAMIGELRGETPKLVWEHLPTVEQVRTGESLIMGEGASFDEVLRPFMRSAQQPSE